MQPLKGAVVLVAILGGLLAAVLTQPLDVSGNVTFPRTVQRVKQRDGVAYRAHRVLGTALFRLSYPSDAVGLQWLKAAAHARSTAEVDRAARYYRAARDEAESSSAFDRSLCRWIADQHLTAAQGTVVARGGTRCGV